MAANYDQVALTWVKPEIDKTLDQAKQSLESYFETKDDISQLRHCSSCLHQVQGTLQMLEIIAGSMLAEEMDLLTNHIIENNSNDQHEAFEGLMRGILQLPRYLERLLSGHDDDPLVILPLLNELRSYRGVTEIVESQFFHVDLEIEREVGPQERDLPENFDFKAEVSEIRHTYQRALLNVMKSKDTESALNQIRQCIEKLEMFNATDPIGTLWWIAHGFILTLDPSESDVGKEIKSILGKIERQIRALQDDPENQTQQKPDQSLLNMMLFHISKSESDEGVIKQLKSEFKLDQDHERSNKVAREQIKMSGPDQDAMITVANVMREDLANIKDTLDLYVRSKEKDSSVLEQLVPGLQQISDTLVMLEIEAVATLVREQISKINAALSASEEERDQVVIDVAGTLLYIDASITSKSSLDLEQDDEQQDAEKMASGLAFQESRQIIIKESRASLQHAKDAIIEYITNDWDEEYLKAVPEQLTEVSGACRIIDNHAPADLMDYCAKFIQTRVIEQNQHPQESVLDALADVLTSIDYYLESLQSGLSEGLQSVLDAATASCEIIIAELAKAEEAEPQPSAPVQQPNTILKDDKETDESLIDDELIEIFLEEAEEVLETLKEHLPRWIHNSEAYEDLTISRRSFHTLKGSGRMVGAQDIGELAWSIENLLNKVIEGSQRPSEPIFQVVSFTQSILPELVEDFRARRQPHLDIQQIQQRADALAAGEGFDSDWTPPGEEPAIEPAEEEAIEAKPDEPATEPEGDLDAELLDIFASEAEEHMSTCEAFYNENAHGPVRHKPDDSLLRALHTLKGSARMAGIFTLGNLITDVEGYFKELKIRNLNVSDEAFALLQSFNQLLLPYIRSLETNLSEPDSHDERETVQEQATSLMNSLMGDSSQGDTTASLEEDERTPESVQKLLLVANELLMAAEEDLERKESSEEIKHHTDQLLDVFHRVTDLADAAKEGEIRVCAQNLVDFCQRLLQVSVPPESYQPLKSGLMDGIRSLLNMLDIVAAEQSVVADHQFDQQLLELRQALDDGDYSRYVEEAAEDHELEAETEEVAEDLEIEAEPEEMAEDLEIEVEPEEMAEDLEIEAESEEMAEDLEIEAEPVEIAEGLDDLELDGEFASQIDEPDDEIEQGETTDDSEADDLGELIDIDAELDEQLQEEQSDQVEHDTAEATIDDGEESDIESDDESFAEPDAVDFTELSLEDIEDSDSSESEDTAEDSQADDFEEGLQPPPSVEDTMDGDVLYELEKEDDSGLSLVGLDEEYEFDKKDSDDEANAEPVVDLPETDLELESAPDLDEEDNKEDSEEEADSLAETDQDVIDEQADSDQETESLEELAEDLELETGVVEEDSQDESSEDVDELDSTSDVATDSEGASEEDIELAEDLDVAAEVDESLVAEEGDQQDQADEVDPEILEIALEESREILERTQPLLEEWRENHGNQEVVATLQRELHTLKGAANMGGVSVMGNFSHRLEDIYQSLSEGRLEASAELIDLCIASQDLLTDMVEALEANEPLPSADQLTADIVNLVDPDAVDEADIQPEEVSAEEPEEAPEEESEEAPEEEPEEAPEEEPEEAPEEEPEEAPEEEPEEAPEEEPEEAPEEAPEEESEEAPEEESEEAPEEESEEAPEEESEEAPEEESEEAPEEESDRDTTSDGIVIPVVMDEDGLEILDIFLEEAREIIDSLEETIGNWQSDSGNNEHVALMQRNLHTLKGGARLSELNLLGDLSHHLETLYESVAEGRRETSDSLFQLSFEARDAFSQLINEISDQQQMTVPVDFIQRLEQEIEENILENYTDGDATESEDVPENLDQLEEAKEPDSQEVEDQSDGEQAAELADEIESDEEQSDEIAERETPKADLELPPLDQSMPFVPVSHQDKFPNKETKKPARRVSTGEQVKVGADTLEDMVNLASESSILRSRLEQQVNTLTNNLEEMSSTIERLRSQLRAMEVETDAQIQYRQEVAGPDMDEFDPLEMDRYSRQQELARGMSESSNDLLNLKDNFVELASEAEALLIQQGQINTELQERLIDTRMVPFDSIVPRLQRMVRQISKELDKNIDIKIRADGEMDRTVLEKMISPIEHMMRNAIDHGIEPPKERKKKGKEEQGKIRIRLAREGAQVVISISDDGAGINIDKVRAKAIERGVITEDTELSKRDIVNLIFSAGVSTADEVTQISGRGVGMDVVFNEIKQLGGYVEVESEPEEGSTFIVRLPFTVSVNNALMVTINEEPYAVPLTNIEGIVTVSPYELEELYKLDRPIYEYAGIQYELNYLGTMLEHKIKPDFEGRVKPLPVMLVHGIEKPVAIQLDGLIGSREVVVKSLGAQLSGISGLSGATILGDGSVVLILDIPSLWRRLAIEEEAQEASDEASDQNDYDEDYVPTVMVVDDSITVRKVTSRLLERNHYDVVTAKDGVDASTQLQEEHPDIILLDIEMPKMDGFELATIVKSDPELKKIPIIMITSRTGEKHKERAMNIGVEDYMGKPFAEDLLLTRIEELIGRNRGHG